jgi:hypothetical protein
MAETPATPVSPEDLFPPSVAEPPGMEGPVSEPATAEPPVLEAPLVEAPLVEAGLVEAPGLEAAAVEPPPLEPLLAVETLAVEVESLAVEVVAPPVAPEPVAPEPVAPEPVAPEPGIGGEPAIATTLEVPPLPGAAAGEGGEFDLLIGKMRAWLEEADLAGQWQKLRGPLKGVALLVALILTLRLYARVVGALDAIPVISGLLELTGLLYALWFSATRLVRTQERDRVFADWKNRWQAFSGRD